MGATFFSKNHSLSEVIEYSEILKLYCRQFAEEFSIINLKKMSVEQYAMGHGDHDNFSYKLERGLPDMGLIGGSRVSKFGIWYDKHADTYRHTDKYGDSLQEAWTNLRSEIISLIKAGGKDDYESIRKSPILSG